MVNAMGYFDNLKTDELEHHGILGQKWGVRRFQNKDGSLTSAGRKRYGDIGPNKKVKNKEIRAERSKIQSQYEESDPRYQEAIKLRKEAYDLLDKYDFDGDDGGGGRTEADRKAGQKYMDLWEKIDSLEDDIREDAKAKTSADLLNKYGQKRMDSLKAGENAMAAAAVVGAVALLPVATAIAIPVVATAGVISAVGVKVQAAKNKRASKQTDTNKVSKTKTIVSDQKIKTPVGTKKDGYKETKNPIGTKEENPGSVYYSKKDHVFKNTNNKLEISDNDSEVTKTVKRAYNQLTDQEFQKKYQVSKSVYAKRVEKYGDPYMNSPLAKAGKKLSSAKDKSNSKNISKLQKQNEKLEKDIKSYDQIKNGLKDKKGRDILTKEDVAEQVKGIQSVIDKNNVRIKELEANTKTRNSQETKGFVSNAQLKRERNK